MPAPDLSTLDAPLGLLRGKETITLGADYINKRGFIATAATFESGSSGTLHYLTLDNDELTETVEAGDTISVDVIPVVLQAVYADSTVASIIIGKV